MIQFDGFLKWFLIIAFSATTIAVVSLGVVMVFTEIVSWLFERFCRSIGIWKNIATYLWYKKEIHKAMKYLKEKNK